MVKFLLKAYSNACDNQMQMQRGLNFHIPYVLLDFV